MARGVSAPSCRCAWPRDVHDAAGTENGPHSTHALLGHAVKRAPRLATRAIQKTPPSRNTYPALNSTNTSRLGSSEPDRIPATNMAAAATVLTAQTKTRRRQGSVVPPTPRLFGCCRSCRSDADGAVICQVTCSGRSRHQPHHDRRPKKADTSDHTYPHGIPLPLSQVLRCDAQHVQSNSHFLNAVCLKRSIS